MNPKLSLTQISLTVSMLGTAIGLVGCAAETDFDSEADGSDVQLSTDSLTATPTVTDVRATVNVQPNTIGTVTATCPIGTLVVGAGYQPSNVQPVVVQSARVSSRSWMISGYNSDTKAHSMDVHAMCLANAGTAVSDVKASKVVAAHSSGCAVATCPAGTIPTGGGFTLPYYFSNEFMNYGTTRGWTICATNSSNTNLSIDVRATCLSGATGTVANRVTTASVPANNHSVVTSSCGSGELLVSGGFENESTLYNAASVGNSYLKQWYNIVFNDTSKSAIAAGVARCLKLN